MDENIDIYENDILKISPEILDLLLIDHTKNQYDNIIEKNIIWATDAYEETYGEEYSFFKPIKPSLITGDRGTIIKPRASKTKEEQQFRIRDKAEVFTPSWICNAQNNLVDNAWFGRKDVFNIESDDQTWTVNQEKIYFPEGKTWKDYVKDCRLEVCCGEAPYLVSRYDTTSGDFIPIKNRIGFLDRKLRVISENVDESEDWLKAVQKAYQSVYAYEWQGDNLLLAREALFYTFIDYYVEKFGKKPLLKSMKYIAYIISWNLWQMDGIKGVVPKSCHDEFIKPNLSLFDFIEEKPQIIKCVGCSKNEIHKHNGIKCIIKDWTKEKSKQKIEYVSLVK